MWFTYTIHEDQAIGHKQQFLWSFRKKRLVQKGGRRGWSFHFRGMICGQEFNGNLKAYVGKQ